MMRFFVAFLLLGSLHPLQATGAAAGPLTIGSALSVSHVAGFGTVIERSCVLEFYDQNMKLVAVLHRGGKPKQGGVVCA